MFKASRRNRMENQMLRQHDSVNTDGIAILSDQLAKLVAEVALKKQNSTYIYIYN